jgi:hypothetical protein
MMKKIWYIEVLGKAEGPYSFSQLKQDKRISPDTLIWKAGFPQWVPIRYVTELKELFADEKPPPSTDEEERRKREAQAKRIGKETIALNCPSPPPLLLFWIVIILLFMSYLFYHLYV